MGRCETREKAIDKLSGHMRAGEWNRALTLAAKWPRLGEERDTIKRAASAIASASFYRSIGRDPDALIAEGIAALKRRYPIHS